MSELDQWAFDLPDRLIARYPATQRDHSRLMHLSRHERPPQHHRFDELPSLLRAGDLLVVNDTRVMPARLSARRQTGGEIELLVLSRAEAGVPVACLARPAKRLKPGEVLQLAHDHAATVLNRTADGTVLVAFDTDSAELAEAIGAVPLPPYLRRDATSSDRERYQTVYAQNPGSTAAPTAGLHFTPELLDALAARGVGRATVTLHIGLGTFRPLRDEDIARGELHAEWFDVPRVTAAAIASTRAQGGRVIAVGTTSTRALASATPAGASNPVASSGLTTILIQPPDAPAAIDGLITNFHLPRSSLLLLVATLCGRRRLLDAYQEAINLDYRFYSYGDAMLLL